MRIQDMFERDIDRDINGVVKVAQEDEAAVEQELSEYVVTRELRQLLRFLRACARHAHGQGRRLDLRLLRLR